jgi:ferredoxin-NADP reductase
MDHERFRNMHSQSGSSMNKASFEIVLKGKKSIAEGTMAFTFEKPSGFQFKAGQHVRMTLINPSETDGEGSSRFFSLACSPQDADLVIAMRMRDTAFKRVLGRMAIGEKVLIQILLNVPHGAFALHDDPSIPAVMLVGGIGIVPVYSMIKDATERKLPHKIFLFYSNRRPEDAPYLVELQKLAEQNPSFKLIATMTQADRSTQSWQGETGYIKHEMLAKYVADLTTPIYYIAGLPEMVSAMKTLLKDAGVDQGNIQAEEFSGFKMNHTKEISPHKWKRHVLLIAIVIGILAMIAVHVAIGFSIRNNTSEIFSFNNPLLYVVIVLVLVFVIFKIRHLSVFRRKRKKQQLGEILK